MSKRRVVLIPVLLLISSAAIGVLWVNNYIPTFVSSSSVPDNHLTTSSSSSSVSTATSTSVRTTHTRTSATSATTSETITSASTTTATTKGSIWHPALVTSWQWQLSSTPTDLSIHVQMYDIDAFENPASQVAAIHAAGAIAICYISGGALQNRRTDANRFPPPPAGKRGPGWAGAEF